MRIMQGKRLTVSDWAACIAVCRGYELNITCRTRNNETVTDLQPCRPVASPVGNLSNCSLVSWFGLECPACCGILSSELVLECLAGSTVPASLTGLSFQPPVYTCALVLQVHTQYCTNAVLHVQVILIMHMHVHAHTHSSRPSHC